jgi:hypothetical protein
MVLIDHQHDQIWIINKFIELLVAKLEIRVHVIGPVIIRQPPADWSARNIGNNINIMGLETAKEGLQTLFIPVQKCGAQVAPVLIETAHANNLSRDVPMV